MSNRGWWIGSVVLALVALVLVASLFSGALAGPGMMGGYGPGWMWGYGPGGALGGVAGWRWGLGMGLGWLVMLAFWGAIIAGAVLLVRALRGTGPQGGSAQPEEPLAILRRRYAAGEISHDEYERMRKDLAA